MSIKKSGHEFFHITRVFNVRSETTI